jgi:hypothetical protein
VTAFLHQCAVCDLVFYGGSHANLCGRHAGRRPNGRCFRCGIRVPKKKMLCPDCRKARVREKGRRWERWARRTADKRAVAEREIGMDDPVTLLGGNGRTTGGKMKVAVMVVVRDDGSIDEVTCRVTPRGWDDIVRNIDLAYVWSEVEI